MANELTTIRKLQRALNERGCRILYQTSQFYSEQQHRPVTIYHIKQSVLEENGKSTQVELFSSASRIQIVLFLRDYWYEFNGWEIPTDNEMWNTIKKEYIESHSH